MSEAIAKLLLKKEEIRQRKNVSGHCLQHKDRPVYSRGRCKSCYESIKRSIRSGQMTDAQAVRNRWLLPRKNRIPQKGTPAEIRSKFHEGWSKEYLCKDYQISINKLNKILGKKGI